MRRFLYKVVLFGIFFILVNYFYLEVLKRYDWNISKVVESLKLEDENLETIFFGASLVLDGIDIDYLLENDLQSHNFGIGGASIRTSYIQLKQYLKKNKKPKLVVLGVGSLSKSYKSYKREFFIHPTVEYFYFKKKFVVDNIPMVKFRGQALENLKKIVSKDHRDAKLVSGQLKIKKKVPDRTQYKSDLKDKIHISDYEGASHLFKMDSICKLNNIDFIVIEMPGYKKTQNDIPVGPHILKDSIHKITLYNLNNRELCSTLFDSKNDWLGNSHLNQYGARKLTKYIFENCVKIDSNRNLSQYSRLVR